MQIVLTSDRDVTISLSFFESNITFTLKSSSVGSLPSLKTSCKKLAKSTLLSSTAYRLPLWNTSSKRLLHPGALPLDSMSHMGPLISPSLFVIPIPTNVNLSLGMIGRS